MGTPSHPRTTKCLSEVVNQNLPRGMAYILRLVSRAPVRLHLPPFTFRQRSRLWQLGLPSAFIRTAMQGLVTPRTPMMTKPPRYPHPPAAPVASDNGDAPSSGLSPACSLQPRLSITTHLHTMKVKARGRPNYLHAAPAGKEPSPAQWSSGWQHSGVCRTSRKRLTPGGEEDVLPFHQ